MNQEALLSALDTFLTDGTDYVFSAEDEAQLQVLLNYVRSSRLETLGTSNHLPGCGGRDGAEVKHSGGISLLSVAYEEVCIQGPVCKGLCMCMRVYVFVYVY